MLINKQRLLSLFDGQIYHNDRAKKPNTSLASLKEYINNTTNLAKHVGQHRDQQNINC